MARELAPCLDCGDAVPVEATSCPRCGYAVGDHDRRRLLYGGVGMALCLSGVLAPVGLPLLWQARRERFAATATVTRRQQSRLATDLRDILHQWLDLERPRRPTERTGGRTDGVTGGSLDVVNDP